MSRYETNTRARFSIAKLKAYGEYSARASTPRVVLVILLTPLATLATSLLPPLVPLRDPNEGIRRNLPGFLTHVAVTSWLTTFGASLQFRASASIPHSVLPTSLVVVAASVATLHLMGFAALLSFVWRFPVPFYWVVVYVPWMVSFVWSHFLVTRGRFLRNAAVRRKAMGYLPSFALQVSQVIVYQAFSAAFESASEWQQIALTMVFPVIKHFLKKLLHRLSHHLGDFAEEVRVSGVEIGASIYQAVIMQTTPTAFATAFVIGVDLVQGLAAVKLVMEKRSVVPQKEIISKALAQLQTLTSSETVNDDELHECGTARIAPLAVVKSVGRSLASFPSLSRIQPNAASGPSNLDRHGSRKSSETANKQKIVLVHALEILQAAESILLVEFLEVAIPMVNGVFLIIATQLRTAIYNDKLYGFFYHQDRLVSALASLALYTTLQLVSVVVMAVVMRVRFRLSPSTLLAFHLERHAWSLQGKMIAWFACLLQFSVMHYGTDFHFKFQFTVPSA